MERGLAWFMVMAVAAVVALPITVAAWVVVRLLGYEDSFREIYEVVALAVVGLAICSIFVFGSGYILYVGINEGETAGIVVGGLLCAFVAGVLIQNAWEVLPDWWEDFRYWRATRKIQHQPYDAEPVSDDSPPRT